MTARGHPQIAYLNDFLVVERTKNDCFSAMNDLMSVLRSWVLGLIIIKWGPVRCLTFLGLVLCTNSISLSKEKLEGLRHSLCNIKCKTNITKKSLQCIAGKWNWATQCVYMVADFT